jgi:hypothetical protein
MSSIESLRIVNTSGMGYDSEITDAITGARVHGVERIDLSITNEPLAATVRLCAAQIDVEAKAGFVVVNPKTGDYKRIRSIEWADGEKMEFSTGGAN